MPFLNLVGCQNHFLKVNFDSSCCCCCLLLKMEIPFSSELVKVGTYWYNFCFILLLSFNSYCRALSWLEESFVRILHTLFWHHLRYLNRFFRFMVDLRHWFIRQRDSLLEHIEQQYRLKLDDKIGILEDL